MNIYLVVRLLVHGSSGSNFVLRNLCTVFHSECTIYIPTNSVYNELKFVDNFLCQSIVLKARNTVEKSVIDNPLWTYIDIGKTSNQTNPYKQAPSTEEDNIGSHEEVISRKNSKGEVRMRDQREWTACSGRRRWVSALPELSGVVWKGRDGWQEWSQSLINRSQETGFSQDDKGEVSTGFLSKEWHYQFCVLEGHSGCYWKRDW